MVEFPVAVPTAELPLIAMYVTSASAGKNRKLQDRIGHGTSDIVTRQARQTMTATFIGLAFLAALNPKLLVVDLLLMGNRRPVPMFVCFMLGGIGLAVAIGLVDVFVVQADAIKAQGSPSAGLDLALGIPLVAVGALLATGLLHRRQRQPHARPADKPPSRIAVWARRVLQEPRFG